MTRDPERRFAVTDLGWVLPLALVCGIGSAFASHGAVLAPVFGVSAGLLLLGWRVVPSLVVVLVGALLAAYFTVGLPDGPIWLPFLVASFLTGRRLPERRWAAPVAVAVVVVGIGCAMRTLLWDVTWQQALWQSVGVLGLSVAAALLGSLIRNRTERERERSARVATEEQLAMTRDLHDGVGHGLAVIAMQAGVALHLLDRDPAAVRRALEAIRDTSRESLDSLRVELSRMSGADRHTPERGLADLPALIARVREAGPDLAADITDQRVPGGAGSAIEATAYAVVQEALTNVLRHSGATAARVRVELAADRPALLVDVHDNGRGAATGASRPGETPDGMGLRGMRQRVEALGGSCATGPAPDGSGFRVTVVLPVPEEPQ